MEQHYLEFSGKEDNPASYIKIFEKKTKFLSEIRSAKTRSYVSLSDRFATPVVAVLLYTELKKREQSAPCEDRTHDLQIS